VDGVAVDDLALVAGALTARSTTVPGIGETIQLTAPAVILPPADGSVSRAVPTVDGESPVPITAVAIPYFQWDNRDGRAMRVWLPVAD
jgi:hypothetical protein